MVDISSTELSEKAARVQDVTRFIDLIRSLDIIFWNLAAFYVIFISSFQDIESSLFPYLSALPLFCIAYSTMKLPVNFDINGWREMILNLRAFSLIASFTFPFFVFMNSSTSQYFMVCTLVALFTFYKFLSAIMAMCNVLSVKNDPVLAKEAKATGVLIYASAFLLAAYLLMLIFQPLLLQHIFTIAKYGYVLKAGLMIIIVFPLLLPLTIMFRVKQIVVQNYKEKLRNI
jgi:hypothetical protein